VDPGPSLRDIACFAVAARQLSFSRAASELGLSQPALSQAIARLERAVGVRLLDRTSRTVALSTAGKALLPYADAVLDAAAAFGTEAARLAVPARPSIRLAYPPLVGVLAARVVRRLGARAVPVEVELRPAGWSAATAGLADGEIQAAILSAPFPPGYTTTARFQVTVGHLAVPAGDPLATVARIRLEHLTRHRILLPRNRPPGSMWARLAERLRGPHRYRVVADDIDDFAAALDLVSAGAGLLPAPHLLVDTVRRHDVRFVPLDGTGLRLMYGLTWPPQHLSAELMALVQTVQEILRTR
jgi:DNA-binding transcriptional LysR family regulator